MEVVVQKHNPKDFTCNTWDIIFKHKNDEEVSLPRNTRTKGSRFIDTDKLLEITGYTS
jgi:hypothetical protein